MICLRDRITNEYFEWLIDSVYHEEYSNRHTYRKLLTRLHDTEFRYSIPHDRNRAEDGIDLRYRFILDRDYKDSQDLIMDILSGPCSVLEMMVALSIRCEENIMDDPHIGDRTSQWFWTMISNLGLNSMVDRNFDKRYVDDVLRTFLDRKYEPDGTGGLFRLRDCNRDLRKVEIWYQLCWFLDNIV